MPTDVAASSPFITSLAPVQPVARSEVALLAQKPKVAAHQNSALILVSDIATHDRTLADTLREKLDFSDVLERGSSLSAADAHGVLNWREYERFEIIRAGVLAREEGRSASGAIMGWSAASIAAAIGAVAAFTSVPGGLVALGGLFTACLGMFVAACTAEDATKEGNLAFERVSSELAKLPAPSTDKAD